MARPRRPIIQRLFGDNPYGTLGPSPARAATINRAQGIKPYTPPPIQPVGAGAGAGIGGSLAGFQPSYQEPNWGALIAGDPEFEGAEAEINMMNKMDRGNLRDAIRRAVIESGLNVGIDEDIDQGTLAAAQANQFSSAADIAGQLRRGSAQSDAELAARGLLSSGQFTENRGVLQRGADVARNSLQNSLLSTIASGRQGYASTVAGRAAQLRQLRASVAARLAQNPGIWGPQNPITRPGAGYGDPFAPLGNASAQQMWAAINSPSVRKQNAAIIARGFDDFMRRFGGVLGGGGAPAAPIQGGAAGANAGTWASLNQRYAGQIRASGNDPGGRPFVILNDGRKVYA